MDNLTLTFELPVDSATIYRDWLSTKAHTLFTGAAAKIEPFVGGKHSAWDGYIFGETLELEKDKKIVQTWTTTNFPEGHPASRLELQLEDLNGGCKLTLIHTEIPAGQGKDYEKGWHEHYFTPMMDYYS
jgi:activator of HSP90 ATPase